MQFSIQFNSFSNRQTSLVYSISSTNNNTSQKQTKFKTKDFPKRSAPLFLSQRHQLTTTLNLYSTYDSVAFLLEMNDLSAMYTFVMAIENARIAATNCQNIVAMSPMM